jgi:hypothetical protein
MPTFDQNNLSQLNFKFKLDRTPEIEYRAQSVQLPGLNLGTASVPTPFVPIPMPGNLTYDDLTVTFLVGENMKDYLSIFNWMVALGHPDNLEQYRDFRSDCSVFILDSNLKPNLQYRFTDAYPISLSGPEYDTTLTETQYVTATVTFRFTRWYIDNI